ncbi:hypothetical protein H8A97_25145 [Bradyrhizobium sp. Arg62]|uniref:hypothetical protein n=1 Tax=Bradyrhizobium TaxID=374 RepID=UPI001E5B10E6|nr:MULTISPECIES: hypothetical protein [Bradyrhizobium]MCC8938324.1 hypothetical protein [Bradyrhizobium ivorense]MCC8948305.1 hypothetical protein [Bradyrhizobium brasilense]
MTGIGRAGKSHVGATEADSTGGSSSSSLEPGLVPEERSQSFDAVVERMRSGPQDSTAPLVNRPPTSGGAAPTRDEIKAAKQKMGSLLEDLDTCRSAARRGRNMSEAQELIDQVVKAGSTVLDYYASLPPDLARRILPDDRARRLRDDTLNAADECNAVATRIIYDLEESRKKAATVLDGMRQSNAPPEQLSRAVSSVAKRYSDCMEWWGKKALRSERMQSVCAATANLPSATPEMRKAEEGALRLHTGWALYTKCMYLQSRIALAQLTIESQVSTFEPAVSDALMDENGRVRLLGTFIEDVFPAFLSARAAVLDSEGRPLDAEHCAVLQGVMERLSEFGSELHGIVAKLRGVGTGADLPLEQLDQIVEGAWVTADEVMRLLAAQPKMPANIATPEPGAAIPADVTGMAVGAESAAARRKRKGKRASAATSAGSSATGRPDPQVTTADASPAPPAKVIVLSDLGTKKLASADEAHARASASAAEHLAMWQAPPSRQALTGLLERLDELLDFDLPGQQSAASHARQMKPEDADHVVDTVVERLQRQAAEIEACVAALEEPRRRVLLTPMQVREVHSKITRLNTMLSEVQGQANALKARKAAITIDCMKTYAFPSQKYLEELRAADELAPVDPPRALKGEPGTLFEIKLQPKALHNGAMPSPMWVHIHTKRPVHAWQLATLDDADFVACHVKSNEQRGYNRHWLNSRAAAGHENVVIHRGKLTPAFCRSLLSGVIGNPWYAPLDAEHASMQFARLGR